MKLTRHRLMGTGIDEEVTAVSCEILAFPADTFFKFILEDGTEVLRNSFGISTKASKEIGPGERTD